MMKAIFFVSIMLVIATTALGTKGNFYKDNHEIYLNQDVKKLSAVLPMHRQNAMLSSKYDEDKDNDHRQAQSQQEVEAGDILGVGGLHVTVLNSILGGLGSASRKIAIGIANEGPTTWSDPKVYFFSGTSEVLTPYTIEPGKALTYGARKTSGPVARGVVGVIGYRMDDGNTLAVMFSVPFDYNLYENRWNARVYPGKVPIGYKLYEDQYSLIPSFKGDNSWKKKALGQGYQMRGAMSSSGEATLEIHVTKP